jgi:hypothetical protein
MCVGGVGDLGAIDEQSGKTSRQNGGLLLRAVKGVEKVDSVVF